MTWYVLKFMPLKMAVLSLMRGISTVLLSNGKLYVNDIS